MLKNDRKGLLASQYSLQGSYEAHGIIGAGRGGRIVLRKCQHVRGEARVERADVTSLVRANGFTSDSAIITARRCYFRHTYVFQEQFIGGRLQPRFHHFQRACDYSPSCTGHTANAKNKTYSTQVTFK